jgi:hypothetical protein
MGRLSIRLLLVVAVLALLCVSVTAFNPYSDDDDVGSGSAPETTTLSCTKDPKTGEEHCESIAKNVMNEEELEAKIVAAEAEREAIATAKAAAKAERDAKYQAEREAKREARRVKDEAHREEQQKKKGPSQDDYKIKAPLKKLKVDYYRYFGVERDAGKLKIRKAANNMALLNHPDKCATSVCKEAMIVINQARDVLLDDETRAEYDFLLSFGFKIYDKDLYVDMLKQYKEDPTNMPTDWEGVSHPSSDYSNMDLSPEAAGWLLAFTGALTLAMIAWPVIKFYEKSQNADAKKAAQKKEMLAAQARVKAEMASLKKKQDSKFTGERVKKTAETNGAR